MARDTQLIALHLVSLDSYTVCSANHGLPCNASLQHQPTAWPIWQVTEAWYL